MRCLGLLLTVLALPAQAVLRLDTGEGVVDLYGKSYALVIGASGYKYWPKLPGVKKDVALVKASLEKHGFEVTTLMDPTRSDFDRAMRNRLGVLIKSEKSSANTELGEDGRAVPAATKGAIDVD